MTRIAHRLSAALLLCALAPGGAPLAAEGADSRLLGMYEMMEEGEAARAARRDPASMHILADLFARRPAAERARQCRR